MISVAAAQAMKVQVVKSIDSALLLMIAGDPLEKTLMASKHAIVQMLALIEQQDHEILNTSTAVAAKEHDLTEANMALEKVTVELSLVKPMWENQKETISAYIAENTAQAKVLEEAKVKKDHSDAWKAKAKQYFAEMVEAKKSAKSENSSYYKKWQEAEKNYQALFASHEQTVQHKDAKIVLMGAEIISLQKSIKEPGIGYVTQQDYDSLNQKYNDALLSWSLSKGDRDYYKGEYEKWYAKAIKANKQLLFIEGVTADLRSLVPDTLKWAEQYCEQFYQNGGTDHYKKYREDGQPWRFGIAVRTSIIQRFVEQNNLIREKWDEKVKGAMSA